MSVTDQPAAQPRPIRIDDANADDAAFAGRIRSAVFWRSGSQIVSQIISWVSTLMVIRILDPHDYGLFAMTMVILNVMTFLNGYGLVSALVQSESVDPFKLRQAFGIMLLLNGSLAVLQLAVAPIAADYYGQPIVADLLRVQALLYLSTPFISIPEVIMGRSLDFRRPAIVNLIAAAAAALVAIVGALSGWGVWTLVWAPITGFWVKALGYVIATGFFVLPSFDFRGTRGMIAFGATMLGSHMAFVVQTQADIFIAGRLLAPHDLGLYAESLFLTQIFVSKFIPPLNDVAFPAYARMQKDKSRVAWSFAKAIRLLLLVSCPLYVGMALTAAPLVETLFGQKWLEMAPYVQIIAFTMPFMTIQVMCPPVCNALGRPGLSAQIGLIGALIMPCAYLVGIQYGAIGLAWAWLIGFPIFTAITLFMVARLMDVQILALIRPMVQPFALALIMGGAVLAVDSLLPPMTAPIRLGLLVATGVATYGAALFLLGRETVNELVTLVVKRQPPAVAEPVG